GMAGRTTAPATTPSTAKPRRPADTAQVVATPPPAPGTPNPRDRTTSTDSPVVAMASQPAVATAITASRAATRPLDRRSPCSSTTAAAGPTNCGRALTSSAAGRTP